MSNDRNLANPELATIEIEEMSRSDMIMKGALAAGAVYGLSMVGPFLRQAFAQSGSGDVEILNFALTLEYLEAAFYDEAKTRVKADGELMDLIDLIGDGRGRARRCPQRDGQAARRQAGGGAEGRVPATTTRLGS